MLTRPSKEPKSREASHSYSTNSGENPYAGAVIWGAIAGILVGIIYGWWHHLRSISDANIIGHVVMVAILAFGGFLLGGVAGLLGFVLVSALIQIFGIIKRWFR